MGEFIEKNIFQIVSLIIFVFGGFAAFLELRSNVKTLNEKLAKIEEDVEFLHDEFNKHIKDKDAHVNLLYMQSIKDRLSKVESAVESGIEKVLTKIERLSEMFFKKQ